MMTITANELSGRAEDFTGQEPITRVMGLLTGEREYEVRERIPPPYDNYSRRTNRDEFYK